MILRHRGTFRARTARFLSDAIYHPDMPHAGPVDLCVIPLRELDALECRVDPQRLARFLAEFEPCGFEPIIVARTAAGVELVEGRYRLAAARQLGHYDAIEAVVAYSRRELAALLAELAAGVGQDVGHGSIPGPFSLTRSSI